MGGPDKAVINEAHHPYVVQLPIDSAGLDFELSRRILSFHKLRRVEPRHGRSITMGNQIYCRWCFSDLAAARAFVEEFGGALHKKSTPEDRLNSARIREHIGRLLTDHYQACTTDDLPPRLREVVKKWDEEKPELRPPLEPQATH
jgi:hypothetical protein